MLRASHMVGKSEIQRDEYLSFLQGISFQSTLCNVCALFVLLCRVYVCIYVCTLTLLSKLKELRALEGWGLGDLRFCTACLGLSNWPIRCCHDPHTCTPCTSVTARGDRVSLSWAY